MPNPSKELFYLSVYKILNKKKYNKTLDVGCGHLHLYHNISTEEYYGIDILDYNLKMEKNVFYKKINFNDYETENKFDLIVIHNTINYNGDYDVNEFEQHLKKFNSLLNENGYLSFNFGHLNKDVHKKINQIIIKEHLKFGFEIVESFKYGLFHFAVNNIFYKIILGIIKVFPILDRNHIGQKFKYFLLKKTKT
tara:strand:+ start:140 stop:721 length:582 start_codon:yes stop_codon:yes gene_type:complete